MFPLQTVLLPGSPLPLHVFEPRYLAMLDEVVEGNREMGVVLIARGREVGGGDVRCDVGTMARVVEAQPWGDGRLLVTAVGVRRIRVRRWLPDDPHPCAETEDWPEEPDAGPPVGGGLLRELAGLVHQARELASHLQFGPGPESGLVAAETVELGVDPSQAAYRAAALSPLGPLDRFQVLSTPGAPERLGVVRRLVTDEIELLRARIDLGAG